MAQRSVLVPEWHPLNAVDEFILASGWTRLGASFVPPESWREALEIRHPNYDSFPRDTAVLLCIAYWEKHPLTDRLANKESAPTKDGAREDL